MSRVDEIKARLEAATPGPWRTNKFVTFIEAEKDGEFICQFPNYYNYNGNSNLVANAPADIAFLLSEVERLKKALNTARKKLRICQSKRLRFEQD